MYIVKSGSSYLTEGGSLSSSQSEAVRFGSKSDARPHIAGNTFYRIVRLRTHTDPVTSVLKLGPYYLMIGDGDTLVRTTVQALALRIAHHRDGYPLRLVAVRPPTGSSPDSD
jgi:hypothetical protein